MFFENVTYDNQQDIVNAFAEFFSTIFAPTDNHIDINVRNETTCFYNNNIHIDELTVDEIYQAIKKLKNKLTSGPDLIPSFVVKDCGYILAEPLCHLFNMSLQSATFPDKWKLAKLCPIFKSGDLSKIDNYRGISILSNFAKVFEIVLYNRIYPSTKYILSPYQHGFVSNRSTVSNLATFSHFVSNELDNKCQVDVIYTDFSKAFDKVDHDLLCEKLLNIGFSNQLVSFFLSYFCRREQFVTYNGFNSQMIIATSGVPQGSNLGPLFFLLFINDLFNNISCNKLCFADDLKIFTNIHSIEDCIRLQNDVNSIKVWCDVNRLHLNVSKCKVVTYSRKQLNLTYEYTIDGNTLVRESTIKDLGVIFDSQMTFIQHINTKTTEAVRMLGFIIRNCLSFTNAAALKILYASYVRSKLEYAALIWNPHYYCHKYALESVQRRFLKFLYFKTTNNYPERGIDNNYLLQCFNLQSLETRRKYNSLAFLHKLLHNEIDCSDLLAALNFLVPRQQSRQNLTFHIDTARTNVFFKSPIHVMCINFNSISYLCDINQCNLNIIKNICYNRA